eukprot:578641-Rhodomonas_salina.1
MAVHGQLFPPLLHQAPTSSREYNGYNCPCAITTGDFNVFARGRQKESRTNRIFRAGWLTSPPLAWQPGAFWLTVSDCQPPGAAERLGYNILTVPH